MIRTIAVMFICLVFVFQEVCTVFAREIVISTFEVESKLDVTSETIMKEAYRRLGHSLKVVRFPGERALWAANTGVVDGELFRVDGVDKKYTNLIKVPLNISKLEIVVFAKGKDFRVTGWDCLASYVIGYRSGVKAVELNMIKGLKTEPVSTYKQAFLKLDNGRTDVVLGSRTAGLETIRENQLQEITVLEPPLMSMKIFHYLHKKNVDLLEPLTKIIQQMKNEGLIEGDAN